MELEDVILAMKKTKELEAKLMGFLKDFKDKSAIDRELYYWADEKFRQGFKTIYRMLADVNFDYNNQ